MAKQLLEPAKTPLPADCPAAWLMKELRAVCRVSAGRLYLSREGATTSTGLETPSERQDPLGAALYLPYIF